MLQPTTFECKLLLPLSLTCEVVAHKSPLHDTAPSYLSRKYSTGDKD